MQALSTAIIEHDNAARDLAMSMGQQALPELTSLMNHASATIRQRCVLVLSGLALTLSHELLFKAIEDKNIIVSLTAIDVLENVKADLPVHILIALLQRLDKHSAPKAAIHGRVVMMLGEKLNLQNQAQVDIIEKYCTSTHDAEFVLYCIAALAKIGVETRRRQFSTYVQSLTNNTEAFKQVFVLSTYISQPWLASSLKALLKNTHVLHIFNESIQGYPAHLRVCDRAAIMLNTLLNIRMSAIELKHKQYPKGVLVELYKYPIPY